MKYYYDLVKIIKGFQMLTQMKSVVTDINHYLS
jgi:hypothetical protein